MAVPYIHLHNHTEYSLLDGAGKIDALVEKACSCGMKAVGISDHGNLYGLPRFILAARKKGIQPVPGCEFYLADDHTARGQRSGGAQGPEERGIYHQILFAKNEQGYRNLIKLSSISFTDGYYYKPRIDHALLQRYHQGLIATTCCLASEVNQKILNGREEEAEARFRWYHELFGDDYYVELQRHGLKDQERTSAVLLRWAQKYGVKVLATNDVHYINQDDAEAHDLLLALQTGAELADTTRFRFSDDRGQLSRSFYFKTPDEMTELFSDLPQALENTLEVADKCQYTPALLGELVLPSYQVPPDHASMDAYLAHLSWERARHRYGTLTTDQSERIARELEIIAHMGFAGYFLIVQEFTNEARRRGVYVGPGRGSAAGSVVAYCLGITDIDPLQYGLLFERFLNPERVSPPDIDIDFDDAGREEVIRFVVERYGRQSVAQIVTFGTMGAKTAVRDVGRVMGVPLAEVNRIAKYIPERPGVTFAKALTRDDNPDGYQALQDALQSADPQVRRMMQYAQTLEGSARHTGVHAAGVIIAPGDVSDYLPVAVSRDKQFIVQYDGPHAELAGMLKMDFLGLKTLSIIKTCRELVQRHRGLTLDLDAIPLDDGTTYELYSQGNTGATFQFESDGMRRYLRMLKPTCLEDLIAMNALFRPGPMDNIPLFIDRKHGRSPIEYPHPALEPILKNTYGIMVYQEQIMETARVMAGYSLGQADLLRRAMGKKKKEVMAQERQRFIEGATANGVTDTVAGEVFDLMEKFAQYGFNKSHSAAYSLLAYRTGYLKAHYPAEYMAAVLSHWLESIEKITGFMEECRSMGLAVLPPDVNESELAFSVTTHPEDAARQAIRFGLAAIKGLGEGAAQALLEERAAAGPYLSIFDLTARVPTRSFNKKSLESLAYGGALDSLGGLERHQYFGKYGPQESDPTVIDAAAMYGQRTQAEKNSPQASLFGEGTGVNAPIAVPAIPASEPWPLIVRLNYERDVLGLYLSAHPLDRYNRELVKYASTTLAELYHHKDKPGLRIGGIITSVTERMSKNGNRYAQYTLEDYSGALPLTLFGTDYVKWKTYLELNNCVLLTGQYKPRYSSQGSEDATDYEFRVAEARLLETVLPEWVKELEVEVDLPLLTESLVHDIHRCLSNHQGTTPVTFRVRDGKWTKTLQLISDRMRIKPSHELLDSLQDLPVELHIN